MAVIERKEAERGPGRHLRRSLTSAAAALTPSAKNGAVDYVGRDTAEAEQSGALQGRTRAAAF